MSSPTTEEPRVEALVHEWVVLSLSKSMGNAKAGNFLVSLLDLDDDSFFPMIVMKH